MRFASRLDPAHNQGVGLAFTTREDGFSTGALASLNLGRTDDDDPARLRANLAAVRSELGIGERVAALHQVHGDAVVDLDQAEALSLSADSWLGDAVPGLPRLAEADAMVCTVTGVALMVRAADCLPVLLADPSAGVIAAAHAGRVGLLAGVLTRTVQRMRGLGAERLTAWIGPHICGACYEVPTALADQLDATRPGLRSSTSWGSAGLDLGRGACDELTALGVRVNRLDPCTRTDPRFFSHRGDGPQAGRQAGLIWLA